MYLMPPSWMSGNIAVDKGSRFDKITAPGSIRAGHRSPEGNRECHNQPGVILRSPLRHGEESPPRRPPPPTMAGRPIVRLSRAAPRAAGRCGGGFA